MAVVFCYNRRSTSGKVGRIVQLLSASKGVHMSKEKGVPRKKQINNSKHHDSSSKLIFGNAELCSQFLRNYMDIPLLKNVRPEDIEDVTERYIPMFT